MFVQLDVQLAHLLVVQLDAPFAQQSQELLSISQAIVAQAIAETASMEDSMAQEILHVSTVLPLVPTANLLRPVSVAPLGI